MKKETIIYQAKSGAIELKEDLKEETVWASQKQLAHIFSVKVPTINEHILNIFKTNELEKNSVIRKFRITATDGKSYLTKHYNLDAIISVGYRVNSLKATQFRIWATKTLKQHIVHGYTINPSKIDKNYQSFIQAVEEVKQLVSTNELVKNKDILELVKAFAGTWFSLESFDKQKFPSSGFTKKKVKIEANDLYRDIAKLKNILIKKRETTMLFAQEKKIHALEGILGNIFQTYDKKDLYPSIEEKAAHLLYFIIKNHPFTDGNKRTGAFSFIWFLQKTEFVFKDKISPEALTVLTLLIAESHRKDKNRMIGLVLLLLK